MRYEYMFYKNSGIKYQLDDIKICYMTSVRRYCEIYVGKYVWYQLGDVNIGKKVSVKWCER